MLLKNKKIDLSILFIMIIVLFIGVISCSSDQENSTGQKPEKFSWLPYESALIKSKVENMPTLLYFYSNNCGWCQKMESENFGNKEIQDFLAKNFTSVRLNSDSSDIVTVDGEKMTERQLSTRVYEVRGYPSIWFLDNNNQQIANLPGYVPTDTFLSILHYIGEGFYKEYTFAEYMELQQKS
ncbi:MAG TPA: thioredoxin fold domain-containing protein [Atribacterota bacterium]|nr:thioredoxin fold domain-containing protein [Atribacterota bacterium]